MLNQKGIKDVLKNRLKSFLPKGSLAGLKN